MASLSSHDGSSWQPRVSYMQRWPTDLTCNCLLNIPAAVMRSYTGDADGTRENESHPLHFLSACYEMKQKGNVSDGDDSSNNNNDDGNDSHPYKGSIDMHTLKFASREGEKSPQAKERLPDQTLRLTSAAGMVEFPGVFDLHWFDESSLLACCTDGCVYRIPVQSSTGAPRSNAPSHSSSSLKKPWQRWHIGDTMMTSCCRYDWLASSTGTHQDASSSPWMSPADPRNATYLVDTPLYFGTFHEGNVAAFTLPFSPDEPDAAPLEAVVTVWAGHEYDAWCCSPGSTFLTHTLPAAGGVSGGVVFSGGDDGLLKLWDLRTDVGQSTTTIGIEGCSRSSSSASFGEAAGACGLPRRAPHRASSTMRFDAGVVSICPLGGILRRTSANHDVDANATPCRDDLETYTCDFGYNYPFYAEDDSPYMLVGSYDTFLSVVDVRNMKRPVLSHKLGGGVWRANRPLFQPRTHRTTGALDYPHGFSSHRNVLAVPLMQEGAALVSYNVPRVSAGDASRTEGATTEEVRVLVITPTHHAQDDNSNPSEAGPREYGELSASTLVYDCAVLSVASDSHSKDFIEWEATVATCSFYEKQIEVFKIGFSSPAF